MAYLCDKQLRSASLFPYLYSDLHEEDIDIDSARNRKSFAVLLCSYLEFYSDTQRISPTVGSLSFKCSTAIFPIKTMHVLISSQSFLYCSISQHPDFVHVPMVCGIAFFV